MEQLNGKDVMVRLSAGEKKRQHIIKVCKKLFYDKGYSSTTYDDICKAADIPPGTITYHFDGKLGIGMAIENEYEPQNKIYIEKMCANLGYSKTLLMAIENFHMWRRNFEDEKLRRFLVDMSGERVPDTAAYEAIRYFYQCVIDDLGIDEPADVEFDFIISTQIGMSDMMLQAIVKDLDRYTWQECAHFAIRFFLRQLGVGDDESAKVIAEAEQIFNTLPIDNRYYRNFSYDEKYLTVLPAE